MTAPNRGSLSRSTLVDVGVEWGRVQGEVTAQRVVRGGVLRFAAPALEVFTILERALRTCKPRPVRVRTEPYVVATQKRVWAVEPTAFEKQNLFGVIDGIAKALTAQLRRDGLIK